MGHSPGSLSSLSLILYVLQVNTVDATSCRATKVNGYPCIPRATIVDSSLVLQYMG
jgi:hypothetical protein